MLLQRVYIQTFGLINVTSQAIEFKTQTLTLQFINIERHQGFEARKIRRIAEYLPAL